MMTRPLRVLLLSPLENFDPACGDTVYTNALLASPPEGVVYETYVDALRGGRLKEFGRRSDFQSAAGRGKIAALGRVVREKAINRLRQLGLLFREPFRYLWVDPAAYDLVHCHVFSVAFKNLRTPLVVSNAAPIGNLYLGARGWSGLHVWLATLADKALARILNVQHSTFRVPAADAVVCFTEWLRGIYISSGVEASRLHVAPCFVAQPPERQLPTVPRRVGFVASDFAAKGGFTVLRAYDRLRAVRPDAELLIVGSEPLVEKERLLEEHIDWRNRVPRDALVLDLMPTVDVFAYPTEADGLPLTVLEVMAWGIPVVTSDHDAMPEIVGAPSVGEVVPRGDDAALASALLRLLDPSSYPRRVSETRAWFEGSYSPSIATARLRAAYDAAVARATGPTAISG